MAFCPNCDEMLTQEDATACECGSRPLGFATPDLYEVALGLDLRVLEERRAYRQAKTPYHRFKAA